MDGAHHHESHLYVGPDAQHDMVASANSHHHLMSTNPDMAEELAKEYAQITKIFSSNEGHLGHEDHEHGHEQQEGQLPHDHQQDSQQIDGHIAEQQPPTLLEPHIHLDPTLDYTKHLEHVLQQPVPIQMNGICIVKDCPNSCRARGIIILYNSLLNCS